MALTGWSDTNFLSRAAVVGTEPFFVAGWCNLASSAVYKTLYAQGAVDTGANYRHAQITDSSNIAVVESYDGTADGIASSNIGHPASSWFVFGAAFTSGSSRSIWLHTDTRVDDTTAVTITGGTATRIGKAMNDGAPFAATGGIAEVSVWNTTGMTLANLDSLVVKIRAGENPININAESSQPWTGKLFRYWPLTNSTTLTDASGNDATPLTMNGTLTNFASHPTIDAAGGGVTIPLAVAGVVESLRTGTTDPMTWSHDQGTTAPKGVLVGFIHGTSATDHVSSVTYGGFALTRYQRNVDTATEPGACEWWFRGENIPTGTQTVSADLASGTTDDILGISITLNGPRDLEIIDTDGISDTNAANPTVTLQYGGREAMAFAAHYSGLTAHTSLAAGANCEKISTAEITGNFTGASFRQTTAGTVVFAIAVTSGADDLAYSAVAISPKPARVPQVNIQAVQHAAYM